MYRVVTDVRDHRGNRIPDPGPWLKSENEAEFWADFLRTLGYQVRIEKLSGGISEDRLR